MIGFIVKKFIGSKNEREVKSLRPLVAKINEFEAELAKASGRSAAPKNRRVERGAFQNRGQGGTRAPAERNFARSFRRREERLPPACAAQDIMVRGHPLKWEMVPFDVQLIGGYALALRPDRGNGHGRRQNAVATLPVYLNALTGRGVHVVTVNDYLAARDSEWMGAVYKFLGLTVGCILHDQPPNVRREQYNCDITYGTNAEFGFDYLRDNGMATRKEEQVQRGHYFAIVDEVDSILIDEARTPLIISGPAVVTYDEQYGQFQAAGRIACSTRRNGFAIGSCPKPKSCIKKLHPEDGSNSQESGRAGTRNRPAALPREDWASPSPKA